MKTKMAVIAVVAIAGLSVLFLVSFPGKSQGDTAAQKIERGKYLVTLGGCNDCHSPKVMSDMGPVPDESRLLSGQPAGEKIPDIPAGVMAPDGWFVMTNSHFTAWAGPWGVSFAANLTPDEVTGIGAWNEQTFISALRSGKHMGAGRAILPPMPWFNYAEATEEDLGAIFAYLKSLKPIDNQVPAPIPPPGK